MRNLTCEIIKSKEYQKTWSKEKLELFIKLWGQVDNSVKFDCDIQSGEQWIRVFKDNVIVGMLGVNIPMLLLNELYESSNRNYNFIKDVHVVKVINFDANSWNIDLNIIKLAVPEIIWHASLDAVNPECMSINDFWYATV